MQMHFQINGFGYDYYIGIEQGQYVYNVVPADSPAPTGGYLNKDYILRVKQVPDLFGSIFIPQPTTTQQ